MMQSLKLEVCTELTEFFLVIIALIVPYSQSICVVSDIEVYR